MAFNLLPTTKKVARQPYCSSTSSILPVVELLGPSSNVSATIGASRLSAPELAGSVVWDVLSEGEGAALLFPIFFILRLMVLAVFISTDSEFLSFDTLKHESYLSFFTNKNINRSINTMKSTLIMISVLKLCVVYLFLFVCINICLRFCYRKFILHYTIQL